MHENGHPNEEVIIPVLDEDFSSPPEPPTAQSSVRRAATAKPAGSGGPDPQPSTPSYDPYRSLLRLLVGGALVTAGELARRLQALEVQLHAAGSSRTLAEPPAGVDAPIVSAGPQVAAGTPVSAEISSVPESAAGVQAAVGLIFASYERWRKLGRRALRVGNQATRVGRRTTRPATDSRLFRPARRRLDQLAERGQAEVAAWREIGRQEAVRSQHLARNMFNVTVGDVVDYLAVKQEIDGLLDAKIDAILSELADDPRVGSLIETQVEMLLPRLAEDPELLAFVQSVADRLLAEMGEDERLQALIKRQGDMYLHYLQVENSEQVQVLIQGQSVGLAGEMLNEVRGRTVTADNVLEAVVRSILRRPPRSELPPPPPEVQALAQPAVAQLRTTAHPQPTSTTQPEPRDE